MRVIYYGINKFQNQLRVIYQITNTLIDTDVWQNIVCIFGCLLLEEREEKKRIGKSEILRVFLPYTSLFC